jgi:hypothetical protein
MDYLVKAVRASICLPRNERPQHLRHRKFLEPSGTHASD